MTRPIQARIDPSAFRHNYLLAKSRAATARAWAVIKANAYGHGAALCAAAVADVADGFAVLEHSAAQSLRNHGLTQPILRLEGAFTGAEVAEAAKLGLTLVVHDATQIEMIERSTLAAPIDVYLKLNTGMNRLGFPVDQFRALVARLRASGKIGQITAMTHFAEADSDQGHAAVAAPLTRFQLAVDGSGLPTSTANSAALLRYPITRGAWVRPGIMLYGGSPMPGIQSAAAIGLQPVMTFCSRIIGVQSLVAGDRVGYGGSFVAPDAMRVGIVACGYADGYPRHAPTGTPVLVDGQRSRTLGRVSMDMLVVDLSELPAAGIDSDVTLWGQGLAADEVATAAGTISYELFCALAPRVPVIVETGNPA